MRAVPILPTVFAAAASVLRGHEAGEPTPDQYREDALAIEALINRKHAYLDRFPGGAIPTSAVLRHQVGAVADGLLAAIGEFRLPYSGLTLKLPVERLSCVDGRPREAFIPAR